MNIVISLTDLLTQFLVLFLVIVQLAYIFFMSSLYLLVIFTQFG